jgi:hypothetical protein
VVAARRVGGCRLEARARDALRAAGREHSQAASALARHPDGSQPDRVQATRDDEGLDALAQVGTQLDRSLLPAAGVDGLRLARISKAIATMKRFYRKRIGSELV